MQEATRMQEFSGGAEFRSQMLATADGSDTSAKMYERCCWRPSVPGLKLADY